MLSILLITSNVGIASAYNCNFGGTIEVPGHFVLGITIDNGYIWATSMSNPADTDHCVISRINVLTSQVESQSAEFHWNGRGICVGSGFLWVTDALNDVVHVLDPATFQEMRSFATPGSEPCGITYDGASLWLTDPWYQRVYQLDLNGNIIKSFPIPDYHREGLEWHDGLLYTNSDLTTIVAYNTDGQVVEEYDCPAPPSLPAGARMFDLAFSGELPYVSNLTDGKIYGPGQVATQGESWGGLKSLYR
jgi:outer membrane protein assembly factor BamB